MVSIEITSLIVSIGSLIPIVFLAVFVEKHFTRFWAGVWNLGSLIVVGLSILFVPIGNSIPIINVSSYELPLWLIPLPFAVLSLIIGFKKNSNVIREAGSSILTASLIVPIIIAQAYTIQAPIALLIVGVITYAIMYVAREKIPTKILTH